MKTFVPVLQPRACRNKRGLGYSRFARHYSGNHSYFLFLRVLRCFSSPRSPSPISRGMSCLQHDGLSHSEIRGSTAICASPRLFAAYHVLHRLREPRHPPCALLSFYVSTHGDTVRMDILSIAALLGGLLVLSHHVIDRNGIIRGFPRGEPTCGE